MANAPKKSFAEMYGVSDEEFDAPIRQSLFEVVRRLGYVDVEFRERPDIPFHVSFSITVDSEIVCEGVEWLERDVAPYNRVQLPTEGHNINADSDIVKLVTDRLNMSFAKRPGAVADASTALCAIKATLEIVISNFSEGRPAEYGLHDWGSQFGDS